jgi:Leucine Rich repeat
MESQASSVNVEPKLRKRRKWRLRILIALGVLVFVLYVISQLEPDQAKRYGPFVESVYQVFNPPIEVELSAAGKQFIADIQAMGGNAGRIEPQHKFFGRMSPDEKFVVSFSDAKLDDRALASLATNYRDRIAALHLLDTAVTDDGLKHLREFRSLTALSLFRAGPIWINGKRVDPITDAGIANLDLKNVVNLSLDGVPITDAGLKSLPDLPSLRTLQLTGTKIEGPGLSRIAAFRKLEHLLLNGSAVTDEGLRHLAGAKSIVMLHLDGMPFSAAGLKPVIALPRLRYLSIRGCQVPYDDVEQMRTNMPTLRIDR